jgi:hypothetical protein
LRVLLDNLGLTIDVHGRIHMSASFIHPTPLTENDVTLRLPNTTAQIYQPWTEI